MRLIAPFAAATVTLGALYAQCALPIGARLESRPQLSEVADGGGFLTVTRIHAPEGALTDQIKTVLDRIDAKLRFAGSRLANAVSVMVSLRNQSDFAAMNEVYRPYFIDAPPARTTVVTSLPGNALIEVSVTAVPDGIERTAVNPAGWLTTNPYSYGIKSGDTLFMSGLISRNGEDNTPIKGDIHTQTWIVMQNARAVLAAADMTFADVVSSRVYIVDPTATDEMYGIYRGYFSGEPPVPTTATAHLTAPDYLVEVTMIAKARSATRSVVVP
jgi:enamine deaminase RidA (YjgF/YER057c/UK114 family)